MAGKEPTPEMKDFRDAWLSSKAIHPAAAPVKYCSVCKRSLPFEYTNCPFDGTALSFVPGGPEQQLRRRTRRGRRRQRSWRPGRRSVGHCKAASSPRRLVAWENGLSRFLPGGAGGARLPSILFGQRARFSAGVHSLDFGRRKSETTRRREYEYQ